MDTITLIVDKERKRRALALLSEKYPQEKLERILWMAILKQAEGESDLEPYQMPMDHYFTQLQIA